MAETSQLRLSTEMPKPSEMPKKLRSKEQIRKAAINYRKSDTGKSCKHCKHTTYSRTESYIHPATDKQITYEEVFRCRKCPFIGFSKGEATDIKKGYICDKFEEAKDD